MTDEFHDGEFQDGNVLAGELQDGEFQDGNVLAGPLREIFAVELTAATGRCASCGRMDPVAALRVYAQAPGAVARCPGCDGVVLRLVRGPGRAWLDLRGLVCLEIALAAED
jgi:Family of unknown function (DUF6510)